MTTLNAVIHKNTNILGNSRITAHSITIF